MTKFTDLNNISYTKKDYTKGDRGRCKRKIHWIMERLGIRLSHQEITHLCEDVLSSVDEADFYKKFEEWEKKMGGEYVKEYLRKLRRKRLGLKEMSEQEEVQELGMYA